jgi:membrane fusion protein, adhesin transport system
MATAFTRTLRRLEPRGYRRPLMMTASATVVLAGWGAWATVARVTLYEISSQARLEVDRAVHAVESPAAGRVIESRLTLGQEVTAGEVLLRLNADAERYSLREENEKLTALGPELAALRAQASSIEQARQQEARAARAAVEEVRERLREAEAPADYAEQELARLERLRAERLIAERDYQHGRAEAQRTRAAAESLKLSQVRMEQEQNTRDRDRAAALDQIRAQVAHIEGQLRGSQAAVMRLNADAERYVVRAPASGRLGEVAVLRTGSVVQAGQRLGVVVPTGRLIAVAQFAPSSAIGRIRPGQQARIRLDGFPWAQYGTVAASVLRVANEIRDGAVRVELAVAPAGNPRLALEHGLPGSVEVAVEQVSPLTLLLRTAGALQAAPVATLQGGR